MTLTVTAWDMTSPATPHTAIAHDTDSSGAPIVWTVTWLPGRNLTRHEAIAAMTIAETVAGNPYAVSAAMRALIDGWAAELGLSGAQAVTAAARPPR